MISAAHRALIDASAISPEVEAARGYATVTTKAVLRQLGFGAAQARVPALLIPVWTAGGKIGLYQSRPDQPRVVKGKQVKYETLQGSHMVLDVPPSARAGLADPSRPLFITEGVRKADAAVSKGLCCIALLGVWNWRGSNDAGGKVALPDWELIALNGRQVFIAFDSDVMTKAAVHGALERLAAFLRSRSADVAFVYLPAGAAGEKVGLDDYFAAGRSVDDLLALVSKELRSAALSSVSGRRAGPYLLENGEICFEKQTGEGPVVVPLCNFDARIQEEVTLDDGVERTKSFVIGGSLGSGTTLPPVRVPAPTFSSLGWVTEAWGARAHVYAGMTNRDRVRDAIQRLSADVAHRSVFTHTGWRRIDEKWVFLTSEGALGAPGIAVDLGPGLDRYHLPTCPDDPVGAMRLSLALLDLAPLPTTAPLWASMFRSPLASAFPLDLALWLEGVTGSLKSTLAALFLSHFGKFERTALPGSFSSTANQLERRAFILQDLPFVIDDYAPRELDRRELEAKAARLLRAQGNRAGRGRLRADLRERPEFPPRGMIIGTGEDRPSGRSILARTFLVELHRSEVDLARLTEAQLQAQRLPHAMAGYIQWLAPQMDGLPKTLAEAFQRARARSGDPTQHLRLPEALAHLALGLDCGLSYAEDIGACTPARASEISSSCWQALQDAAAYQAEAVDEARPTRLFLETLGTLLVQRRVTLLSRSARDFVSSDRPLIGWFDDDAVYLLPGAAYQAASQFLRVSGEGFPLSEKRLRRDLVAEGISDPDAGRTTSTLWVGDQNHRVLRLRQGAVSRVLGRTLQGAPPVPTGPTGLREEG